MRRLPATTGRLPVQALRRQRTFKGHSIFESLRQLRRGSCQPGFAAPQFHLVNFAKTDR